MNRLAKCRDCGHDMSYFAEACPSCGAHYTRALGTYNRKLTYTGIILLVLGVWCAMSRNSSYLSSDVRAFLSPLRSLTLMLGAMLLAWGILHGAVRRALLKD